MKRLVVAAVLAAVSLSVGCLECPEGTVKCSFNDTTVDVDIKNQTLTVRRTRYRTCVTPNECPGPPSGLFDPGSIGSGIDSIALQLVAMTGRLDRTQLQVDVDSAAGEAGQLEGAEFKVRVARLGADGELLRHSDYAGPLELVEARVDGWSFIPAAAPMLGDYVAEMARMAAGSAPDEQIVVEYEVALTFDRALGRLKAEDIDSRLTFAGQPL
jgi:hypothetical protein